MKTKILNECIAVVQKLRFHFPQYYLAPVFGFGMHDLGIFLPNYSRRNFIF